MSSRIKWTNEEEELLRYLREEKKIQSWKEISQELNQKFERQDKTGKQCRERYINYVRFSGQNSSVVEWSSIDDQIFTELYLENGPKWCLIVTKMTRKSENSLKNRFYGGLRRIVRKINKVQKFHRVRKTKPIRYQTLIRVLDYQLNPEEELKHTQGDMKTFKSFINELKRKLLSATWKLLNGDQSQFTIVQLIEEIHDFNTEIRSYYMRKAFKADEEPLYLKQTHTAQNQATTPLSNETQSAIHNIYYEGRVLETCDVFEITEVTAQYGLHLNKQQTFELPEYVLGSLQWRQKPISYDLDLEYSRILKVEFNDPLLGSFY